jgi:predicted anti-sigma-YlaC factor YlaD
MAGNHLGSPGDHLADHRPEDAAMAQPLHPTPACGAVREVLSARLDGEPVDLPLDEVHAHLATCEPCAAFDAALPGVNRRVRVAAADAVPDLTAPILVALTDDRRSVGDRRLRDLRVLIGLAGAVQLVLAVPVLLGLAGPAFHLGRDLGALELALGLGLVLTAYQPHRAAGVLPIAAAATVVVLVGAVVDVAAGRATLAAELTHLSEVVGVLALWALTRRLPDPPSLRPVPAA